MSKFGKLLRRYVRRQPKWEKANVFYWSVHYPFSTVFGDQHLRITMSPTDDAAVHIEHTISGFECRLRRQRGTPRVSVEHLVGRDWQIYGVFDSVYQACYIGIKLAVEALMAPRRHGLRTTSRPHLHCDVPRLFNLQEQWTTPLHRSGWAVAIEALECLHDPQGVIFNGFVEADFCWRDSGVIYQNPWVGVIHNPPHTPAWAARKLTDNPRWRASLPYCKGIFVLSEHLRQHLLPDAPAPISVVFHPTETPVLKFSPDSFHANQDKQIVQVGQWLRHPNSLYKLTTRKLRKIRLDVGFPWIETSREHFPREAFDAAPVSVLPRLDNDAYDELFSRNVIFLHLLDTSASNVIVECIVRNTPVLVNRLPAAIEYLGKDYPFFFDDLEEAARKADDFALVEQTYEYLRALPKHRYTQEAFVQSVIESEVYQSLLRERTAMHSNQNVATLHHKKAAA